MCRMTEIYPKKLLYTCIDKKAFLSNANRPLSDSLCFIVNKFERVGGGGCTVRSKFNKFEHVSGWGPVQSGWDSVLYGGARLWSGPCTGNRQTDTVEDIIFATQSASGNHIIV